ncbi:LytR/AlgR family response regulator transcription factor [Dyadobacter psychrophilus]|uniref:Two component transcriptional regulator, LytTR family n=1 Tax=Dyadobacter psychrophilus TaxID=651661 RepID=A0A1T5DL10_9BACT|nr:LytTR family DNA-binding domain-containing protein [Dyadobacter psychrophilus]SKB72281.1 two component transcriptional regulator, LytTR family [Dyadobacter psychrophilus]
MINALIIDDEIKARLILAHYLETAITEQIDIKHAESVNEALEIMKSYEPGIVFLDVEMPYRNGFDFLMERKNPDYDIVFTTAYNQYAIQAIRFSALDYLLKPVDPGELQFAIDRHLEKVREKIQAPKQELFDNLVENIQKKEIKDFRLAVPSSEGVFFFTLDEILRLEADKNYTSIHLVGKRPFVSSKTLKHFDEMLGDFNFIRTHKSHLVNSRYIKQVAHNNQYVLLADGSQVEVSRRKKEEVQQQLNLRQKTI